MCPTGLRPTFFPFDRFFLSDDRRDYFLVGVEPRTSGFYFEEHDFPRLSFGQYIQHKVVKALADKDNVF